MGVAGEIDYKVLRLKELASNNTVFPSYHLNGSKLAWNCVGCGNTLSSEEKPKGTWCDMCWGVLRLEAGYDR